MTFRSKIIWTLRELTTTIRQRQMNKFDVNIGVSGKRGVGKSTFLFKIFNSFKKDGFLQIKHQVYNQEDVINLLAKQSFRYCWDDEAINSGYKRDFQKVGQKNLVKIITNYRDNYNIYASALPFFYSLDKDLRELIFCHVHIIQRGVAVILLPLPDQIHGSDPWDTKNNTKIEIKENIRLKKNPDLSFRYHKLTTFAGYIYFGPMTKKQERIYQIVKQEKRAKNFGIENPNSEKKSFNERVFDLLIDGKLTNDGLMQMCLAEGVKYSTIRTLLNTMLKDRGEKKTLKDFYRKGVIQSVNSIKKGDISGLVPSISS